MALVGTHVVAYTTLSPIDELQHVDATLKGSRLQIVREGEQVATPAMREQSCRGIDSPDFVSPACDAPILDPDSYQEGGYNTAAIHPPTYYVLTGVGSRVVMAIFPFIDSPVTAARVLGHVWLALGLIMTFVLGRALGASRRASFLSAALVAATPSVVLASSTVTPDAAALFSGAVLTAATVLYLQGRTSVWWLAPAGMLATAFKATGILVVGACALVVVFSFLASSSNADPLPVAEPRDRRRSLGESVGAVIAIVTGGALPVVVWTAVARVRAFDSPPNPMSRFDVDHLDLSTLAANLLAFAPPTQNPYLSPPLRTALIASVVGLLGYLLVGANAVAVLSDRVSKVVRALGLAGLVTMLIGGPLFVVLTYVSAGSYFPVPPRYGLVLVPAALGILALLGTYRRGLEWVMIGVLAAELFGYGAAIGTA